MHLQIKKSKMLNRYKHILIVVLAIVIHLEAVAQSTMYKDVLLDGKPAKLNTETGEVKLVNANEVKKDSAVVTQFKIEKQDSISTLETDSEVKTTTKKMTTLVYEVHAPESEITTTDYHTVQKGETLYGLSKRYSVSLADLKQANNLETTLIKTGQVLRVQNFDDLFNSATWLVVKGDTLYSISKKTGKTVEQLKQLNDLPSNLIKIGQILRLK